jgi:hypothetical protein
MAFSSNPFMDTVKGENCNAIKGILCVNNTSCGNPILSLPLGVLALA